MFFLAWTRTAGDHNMGRGEQMALTLEQVQPVVQKYVDEGKSQNPQDPLWVFLASSDEPINVTGMIDVTGMTFGTTASPKARMELPIPRASDCHE
jgi:hypothetical protein